MGVARDERSALCDLLDEVGPEALTLCEGWQTRDLAAHLAVRERRPDAAAGVLVPALAGRLRRVQDGYAARPWASLVELLRSGPPRLSPMSLPALDELMNTAEFLVHHEDVRRAQPDWSPRPADDARDSAAWRAVARVGRLLLRKSPVPVVLRTPDDCRAAVRRGDHPVTVVGEPVELLLFVFGRDENTVTFEGPDPAVAGLVATPRGL